jgi:acetyl esterase/lipase
VTAYLDSSPMSHERRLKVVPIARSVPIARVILLTLLALAGVVGISGCRSMPSNTATVSSTVVREPTGVSTFTTRAEGTFEPVDLTIRYGDETSQFGRLRVPARRASAVPVVVLIHGGFWRDDYGLDLMDPLAADLNGRGYATWNIEYRRVGEDGGGYPGTLVDVAAAVDQLIKRADMDALDLAKVVFIGHSSGGHLALWAASRSSLSVGQPGAGPRVVPRLAIGLGPIGDLHAADNEALGGGAVAQFIGGHFDEFPDRYAIATPSTGVGVKLAVVLGSDDDIVPARFTEPPSAARVETINSVGDHFALIDPMSSAWASVVALLEREVPVARPR